MHSVSINSHHVSTVVAEFQLWIAKWKRLLENGNKLPEFLLGIIEKNMWFRFISEYLCFIANTCYTPCKCSHKHSTLRMLLRRGFVRIRAKSARIGLALLNIHRDIAIGVIITKFGKTKQRRLHFIV